MKILRDYETSTPLKQIMIENRDVIFISHAAPDDNEFTKWLSFQLIGLGYKVWSDVVKLKGGEDFWVEIENEIRNSTIKFLYVLTKTSNQREGALKELTVAQKVKKHLEPHDPHFIIPLHLDCDLTYDEINIDLVRLNSINFKTNWQEGLKRLVEKLIEDNVPKSTDNNFETVRSIWLNTILKDKAPIEKSETYSSNWFPILQLPEQLHFHKFSNYLPYQFQMWQCKYPAYRHKDYFGTFAWCYDFMEEMPKTERYDPKETISVSVADILSGEYNTTFISSADGVRIITNLLNRSFANYCKSVGMWYYKLANKRSGFWFPDESLEKNKINGVLMVGKMKYGKDKRINWHFGISGNAKFDQQYFFVIKSHIFFTEDGRRLIPSDSIQHKARRKQGKGWWNKHWREKLMSAVNIFSDEENIRIPVGDNEVVVFSKNPFQFLSPVSYLDPNEDNLPDDTGHEEETDADEDFIPSFSSEGESEDENNEDIDIND